jgi:O-antigen ligase
MLSPATLKPLPAQRAPRRGSDRSTPNPSHDRQGVVSGFVAKGTLTAAGRFAFAFLWLFVLSFPAEKAIDVPGLGTISRFFGLIALGAGMLAVLIDGRIRVFSPMLAAPALFVLWSIVTVRWSLDPISTAAKGQTYLQLLGMAWLIWEFAAAESRIASLMQAYVLGTLYSSFDTVSRWAMARQTYYQRYATEGFDPNDMALTLALSLAFSYYLSTRSRGTMAWVYRAQMVLALLTILLSASRTGFLTSCLAALILPLSFPYLRRAERKWIACGAAVAILAAVAMIPATSWKRLSTIGSEVSSGSLNSRSMIWRAGLVSFRQHPVAGVGGGAFPRSVEPMLGFPKGWSIVAHNTFFSVLVETGVVGFTLFSALLLSLLLAVRRMQGLKRVMWAVTLLVWGVGVSTLSWEIQKPTWLIFALILAEGRLPQTVRAPRSGLRMGMKEVALP